MVMNGDRPQRAAVPLDLGLSDCVWEQMERCWAQDRCERPTIEEVLANLTTEKEQALVPLLINNIQQDDADSDALEELSTTIVFVL